jgi:hypothetical protein
MKRRFVLILAACAIAALASCNRSPKQEEADSSPSLDHVTQGTHLPPQQVARGLFKITNFEKFAFDVPPHVFACKLQGEFSSFIQGTGGARISNETADVELLVMTDEQFDAFQHKTSAESLYAIEPSHDHAVSISLPTTQDEPKHYVAVFRRSNDGKNVIWVKADLKVDFGS